MNEPSTFNFSNDIHFPVFDFNSIQKGIHYSILIVGGRFSGKTTLLSFLWNHFKTIYDLIIVFCNNPHASIYKFLDEKDKRFVFTEYSKHIVKDVSDLQRKTKNLMNNLILFDDCSSRKGNKFDDALQQLYIRGRNIKTTIIMSTQSMMFVTKESRGNLDYLIILDPKTQEIKESLAKIFLWNLIPIHPNIKKKQEKLDYIVNFITKYTQDHNMLVVDFREHGKIYTFRVSKNSIEKKSQDKIEKTKNKEK